ncbi:MAG TPA: ABC transporter substrate-binding protein [Candidatus Binatia bacterium]|nr:ABC transporter substrate-binding protein [Candidatus Binatia bacterium]
MIFLQPVVDGLSLPPRRGKVRIGVLRRQLKRSTPTFILPRRGGGKILRAVVGFAPAWFFFLVVAAQAAETPKERIAIAYAAISPSMSGLWMAKEIGAFERNGLIADLVHISSGAISIQALVGGSVHAALGASNAVVAATVKGAPIIAVASNTSRPGMQLWVQPEIQRAEQLQGKTLAITRFGSTSDFVTRLVLRKLNLEGKTELRQFGGVVEADIGFRARQAEGRVSSQAPGPQAKMLVDAAELGIPFSMNLLGVSNDYLQRSPKSVEAIVRAYIEGIAALKTRKAQALKLLEKYMGQRGGSSELHYEFVTRYLDAVPRVDPAAVDTVLEMVGSKGPPKAKLFDNSIVDRLAQEGFIDKLYKGAKQ